MAQGSVKKAESGGTQPNLDRHRFRPSTGRGSGDRWMAYSVARPLTRRVSPLRPQRRPRSFRGRVVAGSVLRAGRNEADRHLHRLRVLHPIPILPGMSCASASPRPAGAPAPPAARSSRRAESSPQGPITASSVNQTGPMFTPVRAGTRLDGRRGFASESSRIDWSWPEPASEPASRSTCALWSTGTTDPGGMRRRAAARTEEPPRQDTQHALGATARLAGPPGAQDTRPAGAAEADDGSSTSASNSSTRVT